MQASGFDGMDDFGDGWPIAASMLQFPGVLADGSLVREADADSWRETFAEIRRTGFSLVELNDAWMRLDEVPPPRLDELTGAATAAGVRLTSLCIVRSSVADPTRGAENLGYTHRSLDAAAHLGLSVVSIGFHRPLTAEQQGALWFWTEDGHRDEVDDPEAWGVAVARVRDVGQHAADLGIELALEMYEDTFLGTGPDAARFVSDVGLSNVGLNPDIGNLVRLHRTIDDWRVTLRETLPHANYWHVKNYFRDEDRTTGVVTAIPAPLKYGLIDYRTAVRDAISAGFRGMFVCEHYGGDGLGVSAENRDYLRTLLPTGVGDQPLINLDRTATSR